MSLTQSARARFAVRSRSRPKKYPGSLMKNLTLFEDPLMIKLLFRLITIKIPYVYVIWCIIYHTPHLNNIWESLNITPHKSHCSHWLNPTWYPYLWWNHVNPLKSSWCIPEKKCPRSRMGWISVEKWVKNPLIYPYVCCLPSTNIDIIDPRQPRHDELLE